MNYTDSERERLSYMNNDPNYSLYAQLDQATSALEKAEEEAETLTNKLVNFEEEKDRVFEIISLVKETASDLDRLINDLPDR